MQENNNNKAKAKSKIKCFECRSSFYEDDIRWIPNYLTRDMKPICKYCLELPPETEDEEEDAELELEKELMLNPSGRTAPKVLE